MAPTLTKLLKPMWRSSAQSRIDVQMAPLWLKRATRPGGAIAAAKLALRLLGGWMTPRQLGPMMRILPRAARIFASRARPSAPNSEKPAEMMIAAGTPWTAQSAIRAGTVGAGVAMTARSIG